MNGIDFERFRSVFEEECERELIRKGPDYSIGADRLQNFKESAIEWGLDPLEVWAIYFAKHITAIRKYVRDRKVSSEPIRGRFMDARNYLDLGLALITEMEGAGVLPAPAPGGGG